MTTRAIAATALLAAGIALTTASIATPSAAQTSGAEKTPAGQSGQLSATPPVQGEAWMDSTGSQDPTLGERRTDKQKNAVETRQQGGRVGHIPDAANGETGLSPGTVEAVRRQSGSGQSGNAQLGSGQTGSGASKPAD